MPHEIQISAMRRCIEMLDSLAYTGPAKAGLLCCVEAFELDNRERAIAEYRGIIGEEDNFACAVDIHVDGLPQEDGWKVFQMLMGVMGTMAMLINGNVK